MSSSYHVQVVLAHDSALPEDVCVNNFSVVTAATDDVGSAIAFISALHAEYALVQNFLSNQLSGAVQYRLYNRADASPRVPIDVLDDNLVTGITALPQEVALCMSFQAAATSGVNQARRRGRIYFGPLAATALDNNTGRPAAGFLTALNAFGGSLLNQSQAQENWTWTVHSQTTGSDHVIANGWVDNEFDTMRSRGRRPTSRYLFD